MTDGDSAPSDALPDFKIAQFAFAIAADHRTIRRALDRGSIRGYQVGREWRIPRAELARVRREGLRT